MTLALLRQLSRKTVSYIHFLTQSVCLFPAPSASFTHIHRMLSKLPPILLASRMVLLSTAYAFILVGAFTSFNPTIIIIKPFSGESKTKANTQCSVLYLKWLSSNENLVTASAYWANYPYHGTTTAELLSSQQFIILPFSLVSASFCFCFWPLTWNDTS